VCHVWLKDPNFSSNVIQYFFTSTSRVRWRNISECLQLRLIFKCSVMSQDHIMFWCNLILCNRNITSSAFMQHHCTRMHIYSHPWSHPFLSYTVHDQALQLQNMHRHNSPLLPFCNITYHHNYAQCTTADLLLHVQHALHLKYYIYYSELHKGLQTS
jgi:hypothetical protein